MLKKEAEEMYNRAKVAGLTGEFETFGGNLVNVREVILITIDGKDRGKYFVNKNEISYSKDGFRQKITLMDKVN